MKKSTGGMRRILENAYNYFCVFLSVILVIAFVLQTVQYMLVLQKKSLSQSDSLSSEVISLLKYGQSDKDVSFDSSIIMPEFIGIKLGEEKFVGCCSGQSVTSALFSSMTKYLSFLFSSCRCTKLNEESGEMALLSAKSGDCYAYIRFFCSVPSELLSGLIAGTAENETLSGSVRELFLLFSPYGDNLYTVSGIARDSDGNVYSYTPDVYADVGSGGLFDLDAISSFYKNDGLIPCHFAQADDALADFYDTAILFDGDVSAHYITLDFTSISDTATDTTLEAFDFNPQKQNRYRDADGKNVYLESHGTLRLSDESIEYIAGDGGGIALSSILSYNGLDGYDYLDYIKCAFSLYEVLCAEYSGSFCSTRNLKLSAFYGKDGETVIEFILCADNLPITAQGDYITVLSITVSSEKLTGFSAGCFSIEMQNESAVCLSPYWLYKADDFYEKKDVTLELVYSYAPGLYTENSESYYIADYAIRYTKKEH